MHPAFSVIFFTVSSGAGYGLLALMGVLGSMGYLPATREFGLAGLGLALAAVTAGLLSSACHLGHPERAWRAFSQWKTSWLSREGVAAVIAYGPSLLLAYGWIVEESLGGVFGLMGWVSAAMAIITVICTAMIYASLKTIRQWCNKWTIAGYLSLALATGFVWLNALVVVFAGLDEMISRGAVLAVATAVIVKIIYWRGIDGTAHASTPESATGLGVIGKVRHLEGPHTESNYLLDEMGYRIARKHAVKLRRVCLMIGYIGAMALIAITVSGGGAAAISLCVSAAILATGGTLIERWLFFAEARHVVTLFYGAARV